MTADLLFPDAEGLWIAYLGELLDVPVVPRIPDAGQGRPASFLLIRRIGGTRLAPMLDRATMSVEAWGPSDEAAIGLAQQARRLIFAAEGAELGESVCYRIEELAGPANLPDPDSEQARYVFTVVTPLRGASPGS